MRGLIFVFVFLVLVSFVSAVANPASVYCDSFGYTSDIRTNPDGSQYSVCIFPDGEECEEWAFYNKECGLEYQERSSGCCKVDGDCWETTKEICDSVIGSFLGERSCEKDDSCVRVYPCYSGESKECGEEDCFGVVECVNSRWGVCQTACTDSDGDGDPDSSDCNDTNALIHSGADEVTDNIDNDCDGLVDNVLVVPAPPRSVALGGLIIVLALVVFLIVVYKLTRKKKRRRRKRKVEIRRRRIVKRKKKK